uniref:Putative ovule protein n=1 Tax=Solanum chacoense TaxID=4108 RepID=A0A0V0GWA7_SOLCH
MTTLGEERRTKDQHSNQIKHLDIIYRFYQEKKEHLETSSIKRLRKLQIRLSKMELNDKLRDMQRLLN